MPQTSYRQALTEFIRAQARPPDKFTHQPRLYALGKRLAQANPYDDDVLFAAAWMHDLGVFIGHRPEEPQALAQWDHVAYVTAKCPAILKSLGFPEEKIGHVLEVIRTHMPSTEPTCFEGVLLRDADILEQLGSIGALRTVSKIGRDTRFTQFSDALGLLQRNVKELPAQLKLPLARSLAEPRIAILQAFIDSALAEADGNGL